MCQCLAGELEGGGFRAIHTQLYLCGKPVTVLLSVRPRKTT